VLQLTATHCNTCVGSNHVFNTCVAVCCSVLQCVAECCRETVAACCKQTVASDTPPASICKLQVQCVAVYCSALQHTDASVVHGTQLTFIHSDGPQMYVLQLQ